MPTVNGLPVPPVIPREQVLVYFPNGILGLRKVDEAANKETPVFLQPNGNLVLQEYGVYRLFSAPEEEQQQEAGTKLGLFQSVADLVPPGNEDDEELEMREGGMTAVQAARAARYEQWFQTRRSCLRHYIAINFFSLGTLVAVLVVDIWLTCNCASLGMWETCARCYDRSSSGANTSTVNETSRRRTFTDSSNRTWTEQYKADFSKCVETDSFSDCQNPSFESMRVLLMTIAAVLALNTVILLVDIGFQVTPRRPFYVVVFLFLWSMWLAVCVMFGNAETTAVDNNMSQIECAMQRSLQNALNTQWQNGELVVVTDTTTETVTHRATVQDCKFSWSFWLCSVGWLLFSLVGGAYFYRRYTSWRMWNSPANQVRTALGLPEDDPPAPGNSSFVGVVPPPGVSPTSSDVYVPRGHSRLANASRESLRNIKAHVRTNSDSFADTIRSVADIAEVGLDIAEGVTNGRPRNPSLEGSSVVPKGHRRHRSSGSGTRSRQTSPQPAGAPPAAGKGEVSRISRYVDPVAFSWEEDLDYS